MQDDSRRNLLAGILADRDWACPGCGYNIRGLKSDRCPECDQVLEVRISLAEPGLGRFLRVLLPLITTSGMFGCGVFVVLAISSFHGLPSARESRFLIWYPLAVAVSLGVLSARVMSPRGRTWLRTLSAPQALRIQALAWFFSIGAVAFWTIWLIRSF